MSRAKAFLAHHWQLFALTAAIFALWQTPLVTPLKILVVYLHELSQPCWPAPNGSATRSMIWRCG